MIPETCQNRIRRLSSLHAEALSAVLQSDARMLGHPHINVAKWAVHSSSFYLDPSRFVALTVENSLDLLRRALGSPRNSDHHLVLNGPNRETPKPLHSHRQPAKRLRTAARPDDVSNSERDLVDAGIEPTQGKMDAPTNILTHLVVD